MKRLIWAPFAILLALAILFGMLLHSKKEQTSLFAVTNKAVPEFQLPSLDSERSISNIDLKDHITIINFFASWCVPCRAEHLTLLKLRDQNVRIIGINMQDKNDKAKAYLNQLGNPYESIAVDSDGAAGKIFDIAGVPESFVIDKSGTTRAHIAGVLSDDIASKELLPFLRILGNEQ